MNRFAKLALLLCFALAASGVSRAALAATADTQTSARLDALEKENAALRARVNRLEVVHDSDKAPLGGCTIQSRARLGVGTAKRKCLGCRRGPSRRRPNFELATPLRGQRLAIVPAARRRQSRIRDTGDSFADRDAQLEQSVALAELRSCLPGRGSLHARRVQRCRIELDASEHHHECLFLRRAHANGGAALFDRPGIGALQER